MMLPCAVLDLWVFFLFENMWISERQLVADIAVKGEQKCSHHLNLFTFWALNCHHRSTQLWNVSIMEHGFYKKNVMPIWMQSCLCWNKIQSVYLSLEVTIGNSQVVCILNPVKSSYSVKVSDVCWRTLMNKQHLREQEEHQTSQV